MIKSSTPRMTVKHEGGGGVCQTVPTVNNSEIGQEESEPRILNAR